jgi:hypothetical protein
MRKTTWDKLAPEKQAAIELCREVCEELIHDIAMTWRGQKPCQMSGWNATWLLYQAVMVPLLSLHSDPRDRNIVQQSRRQVQMAMNVMRELQPWSTTVRRSLEVVISLYESSKRHAPDPHQQQQDLYTMSNSMGTPTSMNSQVHTLPSSSTTTYRPNYIDVSHANTYGDPHVMNTASQDVFMDNMFDSLKWSTSWDSPIGGPQMMNGWDYSSMQNWAGIPQAEEYFATPLPYPDDTNHLPYNMEMHATAPTSHSSDLMHGQYVDMQHRNSM